MRVTIVGSGTLLPDSQHTSPAHWVEFGDVRLLLDCGAGAVHGMARERLAWRALSHVFVSHFHTDHVGDLAALMWALRYGIRPERTDEPLVLLGARGLRAHVEALAAAHGPHVREPGFPLVIHELAGGDAYEDPAGRFTIRTHSTPHTDVSLAVRVETGAGTVGYTGDTGPSASLGTFFRGMDTLISECGYADPPEQMNHLSPRSLTELANAASPKVLLITHLYPPLRHHQLPDLMRDAGYAGDLLVANDGTTVEIDGGTVTRVSG